MQRASVFSATSRALRGLYDAAAPRLSNGAEQHYLTNRIAAMLPRLGSASAVQCWTQLEKFEERWEARNGPFVFHRDGEKISYDSLEHAWGRARKRTKLTDRLMHDLRRTAARDFRRAGVSEGEIMKLCGWKTRAMFDRYNIIDEADLASAVGKRFSPANGTVTAQERASRQGAAA